jgi:RNA polymerase sigma-70 factor (ECF subfamily)
MSADPDAELVRLTLAGTKTAFDELVNRHRPGLVRFIRAMIWDADEAESLAQDALTRALAQLADFKTDRNFRSWLRGIALNRCRDRLRERARHAKPVAPETMGDIAAPRGKNRGVLSDVLRREAGDCALHAVALLPDSFREAFVLHYLEGMDYAEMAELTGTAEGTLRVRAHRARTLLQGNLTEIADTWMLEEKRLREKQNGGA